MENRVEFSFKKNGSKSWWVVLPGMQDIVFHCIDREAAENLLRMIEFGTSSIEVREATA